MFIVINNDVELKNHSDMSSLKNVFKNLGVCALFFSNLETIATKLLLSKICETDAFSYLKTLSLIVFDKEKDAAKMIPYEIIFEYFYQPQLSEIPKFFVHIHSTLKEPMPLLPPVLKVGSNIIAFTVSCPQSTKLTCLDSLKLILEKMAFSVPIIDVFTSIEREFKGNFVDTVCTLKCAIVNSVLFTFHKTQSFE